MKDRIRQFLNGYGIYAVLLLSAAIVGITALTTFGKKQPELGASQSGAQTLEQALLTAPTPRPTLLPSPTPTPKAAVIPDITPAPNKTAAPTPAAQKLSAPVKGKIQWRFAVNELIYSKTLEQWMTHGGVDITCALGEEVVCPLNGRVEEIRSDDSLGTLVRISHNDGFETVYANLREEPPVKAGQPVAAGEVIGYVGETAAAECGEGAHLHLEAHQGGQAIDPEAAFELAGQR